MIAYIIGEAVDIEENKIVLEQNHMGFNIFVPSTVMNMVRLGEEVKIYTHLSIKEDAHHLYGFLSREDLDVFRLLLGVNGIGPKAALAILSALSTDELRFAVLADDTEAISRAPGIGKKTAQKLILELKDKMNLEDAFEEKLKHQAQAGATGLDVAGDALSEAVQALVALGYSNSDALRAVRRIDGSEEMDVEELLKAALKQI